MCRRELWHLAAPARRQRRGAPAPFVRNSGPGPPQSSGGRGISRGRGMCGIIGIIGKAPVTPLLIDALKRLEYRGYDSAGVATLVNGHIERRRAEGKLIRLEERLGQEPLAGTIGIGHTRWATHGKPSERNAHPIATDRVAVVHNGIIENFQELKDELLAEGRRFESDTDTEVVAQLLTSLLERQMTPEQAMGKAMERLKGAFALVALFSGRHDILMGARRGSSLAV